jgi:hypothetical protein
MLRDGTPYVELGSGYFENQHKEETVKRAVKKLEKQGYKVTLETS